VPGISKVGEKVLMDGTCGKLSQTISFRSGFGVENAPE